MKNISRLNASAIKYDLRAGEAEIKKLIKMLKFCTEALKVVKWTPNIEGKELVEMLDDDIDISGVLGPSKDQFTEEWIKSVYSKTT